MINKNYIYAIIGASNDPNKYGHKVLADLLSAGYKVFPVNPKGEPILGLDTYKSVLDISAPVDVAVFVVPPETTERVLLDVKTVGIKKAWMQPGSESEKAIHFCLDNGIECTHDACIMIERAKLR